MPSPISATHVYKVVYNLSVYIKTLDCIKRSHNFLQVVSHKPYIIWSKLV